MTTGLWDYVRAAFSARPVGMLVPPNWVGLGALAFLGLLNPGFWILGTGLELGYLYMLVSHPRFRRVVDAGRLDQTQRQWQMKLAAAVARLDEKEQERYRALEQRCRGILQQQGGEIASGLKAQSEGLGRLLWIYLKLLLTRQSIFGMLHESGFAESKPTLDNRIKSLQKRLADEKLSDDLSKSLAGQLEILQQRQEKQQEASQKLAFLEAELSRIQEQVELIREQAVLATDPETVSQRIDKIAATLGGTSQWIREQQKIYGKVEDLLTEPPLTLPVSSEESS